MGKKRKHSKKERLILVEAQLEDALVRLAMLEQVIASEGELLLVPVQDNGDAN